MKNFRPFDFSSYDVVNYLLPQFIERLGVVKSKYAFNQAFDMQRMNGNESTLPVLLTETCGLALASSDSLYSQTGILCSQKDLILLVSIKNRIFQVIHGI